MGIKATARPLTENLSFCFQDAEREVDIYSQETLETIKNERLKAGSDFYLAVTKSGGKFFFFDGCRFVEQFVRTKEGGQQPHNPLTREIVSSVKIFKAISHGSGYKEEYDENSIQHHVNCLPILLSDPSKPNKEKRLYYFMLAQCYQVGKNCEVDNDRALFYLRTSAQLGYGDAQLTLSSVLRKQGAVKESVYWAVKQWEGVNPQDIPMKGLIDIANCLETLEYYSKAFGYYHAGACRGDAHAIAKIIYYYEQGLGIEKNLAAANVWRQFIPIEWRNENSLRYLEHTCHNELGVNQNTLDLPKEMVQESLVLSLPDPSDFPETHSLYSQIKHIFTRFLSS